jgi:hypothetical protein
MTRFQNIKLDGHGNFNGAETDKYGTRNFSGGFPLFLIREAWSRGCSFEDLADGFGKGLGTCGGDWSGIRDSSNEATNQMLERALNHLFGR